MVDKIHRTHKLEFSATVHAEQEDASEESETIFGRTLQAGITILKHISINRELGQISGVPLVDESYDETSQSELDSGSDVSASSRRVYSTSDEENFVCDSFSSSDEDDDILQELPHLTERVNGDFANNLTSAITDLDLTRTYSIEHEQREISIDLETTTLDQHAGEIYAPLKANAK